MSPRKRKAAAPPVDPAVAHEQHLEQIERDVLAAAEGAPLDADTVASRLFRLTALIAAADENGIPVSDTLRAQVPSLAEVVAEYKAINRRFNDDKATLDKLKAYLLEQIDAGLGAGEDGSLLLGPDGAPVIERYFGATGGGIDRIRLVELGVAPAIIDRATLPDTPWQALRVLRGDAVRKGEG